jgi:hypothetical protein
MTDEILYAMWFYGDDGEFEYMVYIPTINLEWIFRYRMVQGLTWTFDGDGWSSEATQFIPVPERVFEGKYYIARYIQK